MEVPTFNLTSFELLASHLIRRKNCVNKEEEYCAVLFEYLESSRKEKDELQKKIEALQQKIEAFKRQHVLLIATRERLERSVFVERHKAVLEQKEKDVQKQKEKDLKHKILTMTELYYNKFELLKAKYPEELGGEREAAVSRARSLRADRDELRRQLDKLKLTQPADSPEQGWNLWKEHVIRVAELLKPNSVHNPFIKGFHPMPEEVVTDGRKSSGDLTSPSLSSKDSSGFKIGKQVCAEAEICKAKLSVPAIDKPMSFTRSSDTNAARKSTSFSALKIKSFHFPQLKMPSFKSLTKNVLRVKESTGYNEDRGLVAVRPPLSSPGVPMSMQNSLRSQEVDSNSQKPTQEVDIGSQAHLQEIDVGSQTQSQKLDMSSLNHPQELYMGSLTGSQEHDVSSLSNTQDLDIVSRTRSKELDTHSGTSSQISDVGFPTRLQEHIELNASQSFAKETERNETQGTKALQKSSTSEASRVRAGAVKTSALIWSPTWEKRTHRALNGQVKKLPLDAQTKESSFTPSPPSRMIDPTPASMDIESDQGVNQAHSEVEEVMNTSCNSTATAKSNDYPVPMDVDPSPMERDKRQKEFFNPTHQIRSEESRDSGHSGENTRFSMRDTTCKIPMKNERHAYVRSLLQSPCFSFSPSVDQNKSEKRPEEAEKSLKETGMEYDDQGVVDSEQAPPPGLTKSEDVSTQPAEGTSQELPINGSQQDSYFGSDGTRSHINRREDDPYFNADTHTPTINSSPEVPTFSFSLFDPQNDFSPLPADGGVRSLFGSPKNKDDAASAPTGSSLFPSGDSSQFTGSFSFNYDMGSDATPPDKQSSTSGGSFFSMFSGETNPDKEPNLASSQPFFKLF